MRPSSILALILLAPLLASPAVGAPADDPRPIVPASEILAKIERGEPVAYDGVIVVGDLDLSGVELPTKHVERTEMELNILKINNFSKLVNSSIIIKNCEIRDNVNFGNSIFQNGVSFEGTNFTNLTWFSGSSFTGNADFRDSQFSGGDANFWYTQFNGGAHFERAKFSGRDANFMWSQFSGGVANFEEAEFSGGAAYFGGAKFSASDFKGAQFSSDANFWEAQFNGYVNFRNVVFSGVVSFSKAKFSFGDADFRNVVFSDGADFGRVEFSGRDADFMGTQFSGRANFREAQFSGRDANFRGAQFCVGDADFGEAQFSGKDANFSGAEFSGGDADFGKATFSGNVNFEGARFSEIATFEESSFDHANLTFEDARNIRVLRLSNATFENESSISLKGTDYERLYVHWNSIKDALVYNGEVYLTLVKNFRNIEYFEDADDCYYQYRRERQSMRSFWEVAKYTDILGWVTCGYGVRPGYTLLLGLFVVLVSAVYYWRRDAIRRLKGDEDESAKFSDAFYFSMMTFTTVGYGDWYPLDRHRKVVMLEGIVGWLTLSLFLVTLANVIIR